MPSRPFLTPLSKNKTPTAEDVNIVYHILNGSYSTQRGAVTETTSRGHGVPVKFTNFDGRMSSGLIDVNSYALDVRNRETTNQRTAAFRRADNKIVAEISGGLLKAVKDTDGATTPTQVIVHGTPAGGVLSGTYPNPGFSSPEYNTLYPTMIMAWFGSASTTSRSDGFSGTNLEVTAAPGWVFCTGQSVKLRNGTTMTVPDMQNRIPIGVGNLTLGATAGNTWTTLTTGISHDHAHEHTVGPHQHDYQHTHSVSWAHSHAAHKHSIDHNHGVHSHNLAAHKHTYSITHNHPPKFTDSAQGSQELGDSLSGTSNTYSLVGHFHNFDMDNYVDDNKDSSDGIKSVGGAAFTQTDNNSADIAITGSTLSGTATQENTTPDSGTTGNLGSANNTTANLSYSTTNKTASSTNLDVRPPVLAWHWIMKL